MMILPPFSYLYREHKPGLLTHILLATLSFALVQPVLVRAEAVGDDTDRIWRQDMLVAQVGDRLALANADWCPQTSPLTGMLLHDIAAYDADARAAVEKRFGFDLAPGLRGLVPGSAAEHAGLRTDDVLLTVGPIHTVTLYPELIGRKASIARTAKLEAWLSSRLEAGPQELTIRRQGQMISIVLTAPHGCSGHALAEPKETFDAWSDGHDVAVSEGVLADLDNEDELAFIVAHEMGHNWLDQASRSRTGLLARIAAMPVGEESRADLIAIVAMRKAGYAPKAASATLDRLARAEWLHLSRGRQAQLERRKEIINHALSKSDP